MSFIGRPPPLDRTAETITAFVPSQKPDLRALSFVLRHAELWPKDFRWNYRRYKTCGIAMAFALWPGMGKHPGWLRSLLAPNGRHYYKYLLTVAEGFGMLPGDAKDIFFTAKPDCGCVEVSPERVADLIDDYLTRSGR